MKMGTYLGKRRGRCPKHILLARRQRRATISADTSKTKSKLFIVFQVREERKDFKEMQDTGHRNIRA